MLVVLRVHTQHDVINVAEPKRSAMLQQRDIFQGTVDSASAFFGLELCAQVLRRKKEEAQ
jgi:hypothetical protein